MKFERILPSGIVPKCEDVSTCDNLSICDSISTCDSTTTCDTATTCDTLPTCVQIVPAQELIFDIYADLQGAEFTGTYMGLHRNPDTGSLREMIEVRYESLKSTLEGMSGALQLLNNQGLKVWKGYTDRSDSYMGYDWNPRIFAFNVNWLPEVEKEEEERYVFVIDDIKVFSLTNVPRYNYGVNISVTQTGTIKKEPQT